MRVRTWALGARGLLVLSVVSAGALLACGNEVETQTTTPNGGHGGTGTGTGQQGGEGPGGYTATSSRMDLLLVVDNSRGMSDKQEILGAAIPDLVSRIANPACVDALGLPIGAQPASPTDPCPQGSSREFSPVTDLHIGVISSSIGDHGGDVCPEDSPGSFNNDYARLLSRDASGGTVATYQSLGFLAWDPNQTLVPPGEGSVAALVSSLASMVGGTGSTGCGFEATLESWYRFLIDPNPWESIEEVEGHAVMVGTDTIVLAQRQAFLRPDSLLVILTLTDENDCSIRDGSQYYFAAKGTSTSGAYHLPKAQSTCATDPASDCCRSCGQPAGEGCPPKGAECDGTHDALSDPINLRCFDEKRRFGIDFLQPMDRYVTGLSSATVADRDGNLVPNPIFSDLDTGDGISAVRDPGLVLLVQIVGVPWQLVARRTAAGQPDLATGLDASGRPAGGFMSNAELGAAGLWSAIVGDSASYVPASDAHMVESIDPRTGLPGPTAGYLADPWVGHEKSHPQRDDLQFACIFPLPAPRDCSVEPVPPACDCLEANNDSPLCEAPTGANGTTQYFAKAYPGLRQLELARQLGDQAVVGSICPSQLADTGSADYAYRPVVVTVMDAAKHKLR